MFSRFTLLPAELRLHIWICSLEKHRLLEVWLDPPTDPGKAPPYSTTNALNKLISGGSYTATVQAVHLNSKLLRVNRESRKAALSFYRVHIPCYLQAFREIPRGLQGKPAKRAKEPLYFNPEYDFMQLRTRGPAEFTFVDFIHDLKAYDPQNVGLLNLALAVNGMNAGLHMLVNISQPSAKAAFVKTLSQLQEIIWVAQSYCGRAIMGPLEDFHGVGVQFNHSMPIKAITPSFDLLRHDPRSVESDLKYVLTGTIDPRQMRVDWQELLTKWDIRQAQPPRERVLFAYRVPSYSQQVYDIKTAESFLRAEEENWLRSQQQFHQMILKLAGKVPVEGPEELAQAVRPAVGFWLFPAEALGALEGDVGRVKKVFDMTGYWPELALSKIS
ncbi:hypothetical protein JX265_011366 [Neoarthrinium moseri]|uniref:2EXR domain-containing protein n=1 Tax=Neoarthrinium moseri TaxID=1658444 RepID=A0A9P9WCP7_9PEZI|nr:hypothetical protein JX265_011366 [Neoarthrinium moseri]